MLEGCARAAALLGELRDGEEGSGVLAAASPPSKRQRVEAKIGSFVDVVDVVATFLPRVHMMLLLRLVSRGWGRAVASAIRTLKCIATITDSQLERLVATLRQLRVLVLITPERLSVAAFHNLRGLTGLETLVLRRGRQGTSMKTTIAILEEVSQIATLTTLDIVGSLVLGETAAVGLSPLRRLPRLQTLAISFCSRVDAAAIGVIASLPSLRVLTVDLRCCSTLTAAASLYLARLPAFQTVWLPHDADDTWLPVVGCLLSLTSLNMTRFQQLTDAAIEHVSLLVHLTELVLSDCRLLTDRCLAAVGRLALLERLDLSDSPWLTDNGLQHLRVLTALNALCLSSCTRISDEGMLVIGDMTSLERLDVDGCECISSLGLQRLTKLVRLRCLVVSGCGTIDDSGVAAIARLPRLETFLLDRCERITDTALQALGFSKSLRELSIESPQITGVGLAHVSNIRTLRTLTLGCYSTLSSDAAVRLLGSLSSLQLFIVSSEFAPADGSISGGDMEDHSAAMETDDNACDDEAPAEGQCSSMEGTRAVEDGPPQAKRRRVEAKHPTPFTTVPNVVGVVVTFMPHVQMKVQLRLVSRGWSLAVVSVLHTLKCFATLTIADLLLSYTLHFTDAKLAKIVAAFPELRSLDLRGCEQLTPVGFRSLHALARLETLVLRNDWQGRGWLNNTWGLLSINITDAVLEEVSHVATLTSLDIAECDQFTRAGLESLVRLPRLQTLDVTNCRWLFFPWIAVIARLPALTSLNLSSCEVTDQALASVCRVAQLTSLDLRYCDKPTTIGAAHLARLTVLKTLRFAYFVEDGWLSAVGRLVSLTSLEFFMCDRVSDSGFGHLAGLVGLRDLRLTWCKLLTDRAMETIGRFVRLEKLVVCECHWLTDVGVKQLRGLSSSLKELSLRGSPMITDEAVETVVELSMLETLSLGRCPKITNKGVELFAKSERLPMRRGVRFVAKLGRLRRLDVGSNELIDDDGVTAIARLSRLTALDLGGLHRITDNGVLALRKLKLRELTMNDCDKISNDAMRFVGEIRQLRTLSLDHVGRLSNSAVTSRALGALPSLQRLSVYGCKFITRSGAEELCRTIPGLEVES